MKNKIKKLLTGILLATFCLCFVSCGKQQITGVQSKIESKTDKIEAVKTAGKIESAVQQLDNKDDQPTPTPIPTVTVKEIEIEKLLIVAGWASAGVLFVMFVTSSFCCC